MRFGIDFGTTRTVVAAADRGNYPVLNFQAENGDALPWFPSIVAVSPDGRWAFGFDALAIQQEDGWTFLRSFKRLLAESSPTSTIQLGGFSIPALNLLQGYLAALNGAVRRHSNMEVEEDEKLEALIAVPANANSNQRFLTMESFRGAGFAVLGLINEPSAAGIEYAHRYRPKPAAGKEHLVVYDLGGGTFDTSVVSMKDRSHEVLVNEGIAELGGDDFDGILADLALAKAGIGRLRPQQRFRLLEECRELKEQLHPNTRRITLDLQRITGEENQIEIPVAEFYEKCQPLVEKTIATMEAALKNSLDHSDGDGKSANAIYLVGGSSDLPIVGRMLRDAYGRRVRRSPYPFAATAIGLAIAADLEAGYQLKERFTRHFGLWRETEHGRRISFDPIFHKGTPLPKAGEPPLIHRRIYHPAHNIGHFRFLECSSLTPEGQPAGDITPWDEILFPFDPALQGAEEIESSEVRRSGEGHSHAVEEAYCCDSSGIIEVVFRDHSTGYCQTRRLRS
jgi:molecular chaperone DnaK (HSP70)